MNKIQAKKLLASAGRTAGVVVQVRAGKDNADEIRVLNASRKKVLASGTIALDASKKGYQDKDVREILSQVRSLKASKKASCRGNKLNCSSANFWVDKGYLQSKGKPGYKEDLEAIEEEYDGAGVVEEFLSPADKTIAKMLRSWKDIKGLYLVNFPESGETITVCVDSDGYVEEVFGPEDFEDSNTDALDSWVALQSSRKKMNCSEDEDPNPDDFEGDDAGFVDDVESIVTDDQGNEVQVDDMLVVQDPETSEIALFIPTDEDEQLPENLEVIGEVLPSDDAAVLDSSRRVKSRGRKMNASVRVLKGRTKLNSSRASLIDQLNEVYESDAYEDVESALAQAAGFSESEMEHLSDADEDEGFYANFTTQQLEKALDILNGNVSESDAKLPLTVAEIQVLKRAMEDYSQPSFTKDREMSRVATQILKKLNSLF